MKKIDILINFNMIKDLRNWLGRYGATDAVIESVALTYSQVWNAWLDEIERERK